MDKTAHYRITLLDLAAATNAAIEQLLQENEALRRRVKELEEQLKKQGEEKSAD